MSSRAKKSGLAAGIEKKLENNWDREEEAGTPVHVCNWVNAVLKETNDKDFQEMSYSDWKKFGESLRNGIILCKLVNALLTNAKEATVSYNPKAKQPFVMMSNIETFNKGCVAFGLKQESCFQTGDLWDMAKGPMYNVLSTLHCLGVQANDRGLMPAYLGQLSKTLAD